MLGCLLQIVSKGEMPLVVPLVNETSEPRSITEPVLEIIWACAKATRLCRFESCGAKSTKPISFSSIPSLVSEHASGLAYFYAWRPSAAITQSKNLEKATAVICRSVEVARARRT